MTMLDKLYDKMKAYLEAAPNHELRCPGCGLTHASATEIVGFCFFFDKDNEMIACEECGYDVTPEWWKGA